MNQIEQVIEKKGIDWLWSRVKSKSPKLYRIIQIVGGVVILALGPFTFEMTTGILTVPHQNIVLPICQFLIACLAGAGITAATTTTDGKLTTEETKANVISEAIDKGKVAPKEVITTHPDADGPPQS